MCIGVCWGAGVYVCVNVGVCARVCVCWGVVCIGVCWGDSV